MTFIGGPFARQVRRFTRIADELAVTTGDQGRPRLDTTAAAGGGRLGVYRFERVNDQPAYIWTQETP